ncbi:MAG: hypothetical protein WC325_11855 [Candidatus Bathyarchaeia archaeon]|jgi:hypothetical protein
MNSFRKFALTALMAPIQLATGGFFALIGFQEIGVILMLTCLLWLASAVVFFWRGN